MAATTTAKRGPGRPRKTSLATEEVTVMTQADFDGSEDQPEDQPEEVEVTPGHNTDDDVPTQGQLAKAIQGLVDSQPVRRVPYAKFKTRSPFNPTGNKRRKLTRRCYQNGFPMDIKKLHDEEIALLNKVKPGKYIGGMVTILQMENGSNTDLHIRYANRSSDQKLANAAEWGNLTILLKRCVQEGGAV